MQQSYDLLGERDTYHLHFVCRVTCVCVGACSFCRCYRVQVSSHDGVRIPLTIAHDRSIVLDGTNRLVLHG